MASFAVILPAAGKSSRFHDKHYKKPFIQLGERAVWLHSAQRFLNRDDVKQVIVIISPEDHEDFHMKFGANLAIMGIEIDEGGAEREDYVRNALKQLRDDVDFVAVHDAARPCIADEWIDAVFSAAQEMGAAILGIPVSSTLKRVAADGSIEATIARANVWEAQTPQVFRRDWFIEAYANPGDEPATDDAELVQRLGHNVKIVQGSPINMKITTKDDLRLAAQALKALPKPKLQGPAHPFADDDMWR
ncbi:MAG: 2-C-methyl-D-erythritol 4-phosphate cytidylyltransferase [Planctomycetes bacterium]|nr:2-C-methyl-D-erythritol 4-phosphate cytidylyltransferase [Planctomycetota bacterium]